MKCPAKTNFVLVNSSEQAISLVLADVATGLSPKG